MISRPVLLGACALSLLAAGSAQARPYVANVGARVTATPPYEGAGYLTTRINPTIALRPADRPYRFSPRDGGASIALIDNDYVSIGPILRLRSKRVNTGKLSGLEPIKWAAEPGGFVEVWPTKWLRGRVEARQGVGGHKGLVADLAGDLVYTGTKWDFSVGPRLGWGDGKYLDTYFGVTPLEAARSPLIAAAYDPTSGRRYTGVEVGAAYHIDRRWMVKADFGYRTLADKAADSPIVRFAGDTDHFQAGIGLSYSFGLRL
jgi:outer membrane protein